MQEDPRLAKWHLYFCAWNRSSRRTSLLTIPKAVVTVIFHAKYESVQAYISSNATVMIFLSAQFSSTQREKPPEENSRYCTT